MPTEIIKFKAKDGIILDGFINKCKNPSDKVLIAVHGMTSNCFKVREKIIAKAIETIGIDTMHFNNRGSDVIRYIKNDEESFLGGTAYEDVEDGYYDIVGAIEYAISLGYKDIYLQGHSLGSTKVVYTCNKLIDDNNPIYSYIKGIILLSLVDLPESIKMDTTKEFIKIAVEMEAKGEELELMPKETFVHPISVKTFLRYVRNYENVDFARFSNKEDNFEVLNKIQIPLFMRWGNVNEMISQSADELVDFLDHKIIKTKKDIGYIDGADHSYSGKEEILAEEIKQFITKYNN